MARRNRRRRRRSVRSLVFLIVAAAVCGGGYLMFFRKPPAGASSENVDRFAQRPKLRSDRPFTAGDPGVDPLAPEKGAAEPSVPRSRATSQDGSHALALGVPYDEADARRAASLLAAGREQLAAENWVTARRYLSEAMQSGVDAAELTQLRADLTKIGDETIFSPRVHEDDPLVSRYIIEPGETLGKIAQRFEVTAQLLGRINGIKNINRIRAGQTVKVVQGPFHAVVDKKRYTLNVMIGNTFVRAYRVGIGADDSTPAGTWKVSSKLVNPTFSPPRGGRPIGADDPNNPLGERWIGLEGVDGAALGQLRYGIHGTIEPDSIGRSVSLGCIRMHNADVEFFFDLVVVGSSTVEVVSKRGNAETLKHRNAETPKR